MKRGQRGSEVIELALVLPLLLVVLLGIAEFGRAWLTMAALTSAAREGCRAAVLAETDAVVTREVRDVLLKAKLNAGAATVVREGPGENDPERMVRVTVTIPFTAVCGPILPALAKGGFNPEFPMRASVTMRYQGAPFKMGTQEPPPGKKKK